MTIPLLTDTRAALEALSHVEVLYSDLDGTLLGLGGSLLADVVGEPSTVTAQAVVRVNRAGLPVVLVTGRNRVQCTEITRLLGWSGFIAELGCVAVPQRGADPIFNTGDWPAYTLRNGETPYDRIVGAGAVALLERSFPGRLEPHAPYHLNREATVMLRGAIDLSAARETLAELELPVAIVDNGIIHPLSTGLFGIAEMHAYHLMPSGVTKAGAVGLDLARRDLLREQAACIGDASTDVEMADFVSLGALVSNALADPRARAAAEARGNVYALTRGRGEGWAEFSEAWLEARDAG